MTLQAASEDNATVNANVTNDDTILNQENPSAAGSTAEDTLGEYRALIEVMREQNKTLMEQNKSLQAQFSTLLRNGHSVVPQSEDPEDNSQGKEPYVSLSQLGNEIGKRDYKSHNMRDGD